MPLHTRRGDAAAGNLLRKGSGQHVETIAPTEMVSLLEKCLAVVLQTAHRWSLETLGRCVKNI